MSQLTEKEFLRNFDFFVFLSEFRVSGGTQFSRFGGTPSDTQNSLKNSKKIRNSQKFLFSQLTQPILHLGIEFQCTWTCVLDGRAKNPIFRPFLAKVHSPPASYVLIEPLLYFALALNLRDEKFIDFEKFFFNFLGRSFFS